jgi:kynureninase
LKFPSDLYILEGIVKLLDDQHEIVRVGALDNEVAPDSDALEPEIDENTALEVALGPLPEAGVDSVHRKSTGLTQYAIDLFDARLAHWVLPGLTARSRPARFLRQPAPRGGLSGQPSVDGRDDLDPQLPAGFRLAPHIL